MRFGLGMGMTRKTLSIFTLGLVDFRSDKERTAAYTRGIRREARAQTKLLREMGRSTELERGIARAQEAQLAREMGAPRPAGWYNDPYRITRARYFDGENWTDETQD